MHAGPRLKNRKIVSRVRVPEQENVFMHQVLYSFCFREQGTHHDREVEFWKYFSGACLTLNIKSVRLEFRARCPDTCVPLLLLRKVDMWNNLHRFSPCAECIGEIIES